MDLGRKLFFTPGIWTILDTNLSPSFELFSGDRADVHTDVFPCLLSWVLGQQIYWFPFFPSTATDSSQSEENIWGCEDSHLNKIFVYAGMQDKKISALCNPYKEQK